MAIAPSPISPIQQQGGFGSSLYNLLFGQPEQFQAVPRFTPEQSQALSSLLQMGLGGMGDLDFGPIEQRARSQFMQQTIPTLSERFTALSSTPQALSSPTFAGQLGQAGRQLEEGLASQRSQYGLQRGSLLQGLLGMGLQPQFETALRPRTPGLFEQALPILGQLGGAWLARPKFPKLNSNNNETSDKPA